MGNRAFHLRQFLILCFVFLVFETIVDPLRLHSACADEASPATSTKLIPLPIYSTLPNEGSTFGFMPVFLVVEKEKQRTQSIFAPSVSFNNTIRFTGTFRWYHFPSPTKTLNLIASVSTNVNRGTTLEYFDLPRKLHHFTSETSLHLRRSIFYRFFGIGPHSNSNDETSYTRLGGDLGTRIGYNTIKDLNLGFSATLYRDLVENKHVNGLTYISSKFSDVPGIGGATLMLTGFSARYDTRNNREYSLDGYSHELFVGMGNGLSGVNKFSRVEYQSRALFPHTWRFQSAARFYNAYTGGGNIPFYYLSSLGGSNRLRGFTEDRFFDKGAWTAEIEERITLFQSHIYGVTADWRIDPFISVGQVYHDTDELFKTMKLAAGLGFRAYVQPNVLGRVDTAIASDGFKIYVELGYPF